MKLKILYLSSSQRLGGAELSLLDVLRHVDIDIITPMLVCPPNSDFINALKTKEKSIPCFEWSISRILKRFHPIFLVKIIINYLKALFELYRICIKQQVDVIHANETLSHLHGAIIGKLLNIPTIWHVRDLVSLGIIGKLLFALSTKIITISDAVFFHISQYGDDVDKIERVYNGIFLSTYTAPPARVEAKDENHFVIGMVANLVPWKRHRDAIEALAIVLKRYQHVRLQIVGEDLFGEQPEYKAQLHEYVQDLQINDRVHFLGYVSHISQVLPDIDVLVHPAINEPFGKVLIEAMALEKPVIATATGAAPEIIQNQKTGFLVPEKDPYAIADSIIYLIENPEFRETMGQQGRKRVADHFQLQNTIYQIKQVYKAITMRDCNAGRY